MACLAQNWTKIADKFVSKRTDQLRTSGETRLGNLDDELAKYDTWEDFRSNKSIRGLFKSERDACVFSVNKSVSSK